MLRRFYNLHLGEVRLVWPLVLFAVILAAFVIVAIIGLNRILSDAQPTELSEFPNPGLYTSCATEQGNTVTSSSSLPPGTTITCAFAIAGEPISNPVRVSAQGAVLKKVMIGNKSMVDKRHVGAPPEAQIIGFTLPCDDAGSQASVCMGSTKDPIIIHVTATLTEDTQDRVTITIGKPPSCITPIPPGDTGGHSCSSSSVTIKDYSFCLCRVHR